MVPAGEVVTGVGAAVEDRAGVRRWPGQQVRCGEAELRSSDGGQVAPPVRDPEWAGRRKLLIAHERLDEDAFAKVWNSLIDAGDPGIEILHAYTVKENLRALLALSGTNPDRSLIRDRLWRLYEQAATSTSPEVHRFAATVEQWWPAIEAAIITDYSNARSEGYNRLAKHQGRNAFGYRNVHNHRRAIRWACTRQYRRASAAISKVPGQVR